MVQTDDRDTIAIAFERTGDWTTRRIGAAEIEAQSEFGELVIEAQLPVLVHGPLADNAVADVNEILASLGKSWSSEVYDDNKNVVNSFGNSES